ARESHGGLDAVHRVVERQRELGGEVEAALRAGAARAGGAAAAATAATEQTSEEVAQVAEVLRANVEPTAAAKPAGAEAPGSGAEPAHLVVFLSASFVAEYLVRGRDLLETVLGRGVSGVGVGVQLASQLAVGACDLFRRCGLGHAEHLVVVLLEPFTLRGHHTSFRL